MRRTLALALLLVLAACSRSDGAGQDAAAPSPAGASASTSATSTIAPSTDGGTASEGASSRLAPLSIGAGPFDLRLTKTVRLVGGVLLHEISEASGPNSILVLEVDPRAEVALDPVGAGDAYPAVAAVSAMGQRSGAIAAVNGEFFDPPGRPLFQFMSDGTLWQTALGGARSFAISEDGTEFSVGRFEPSIRVTGPSSPTELDVSAWNTDAPSGGEIVGLTHVGGTLAAPPDDARHLVLGSPGDVKWTGDRRGTTQPWTVSDAGCGEDADMPASPTG